MNRPIGFIQARMNSVRFPGKVLYRLKGKPMLEYLLDRMSLSRELDQWVVLTSIESTDNPIVSYCQERGVPYFRGPLDHVAKRFKDAIDFFKPSAFVRITADSPWMDPVLVDEMMRVFRKDEYDFLSNVRERTFPKGMSIEILSAPFFLRHFSEIQDPSDQEHVTSFFQRRFSEFKSGLLKHLGNQCAELNLSVDTDEDMQFLSQALDKLPPPYSVYGWKEIAEVYQELKKASCLF